MTENTAAPAGAPPAWAPTPPVPAPPAATDPVARPKPRLRILLSFLHLVALGVVGPAVIAGMGWLLGFGVTGILFAGLGLILLLGLVYVLFGVAWFEVARVDGLYRLGVPGLRFRSMPQRTFLGFLEQLFRQLGDGRMWRALASFAITSAFGALVVGMATFVVSVAWRSGHEWTSVVTRVTNSQVGEWIGQWWILVTAIVGVIALAAALGLTALARTISIALVRVMPRRAELTRQVRVSSAQREGAVRAAEVERTRIERDLHDGVQPRLVSVGMTLGLAQQKIDTDPAAAKELISEAHTSTKAAITELRQLARGIHASVLDDRGLDAALSALAGRSHIPVQLDVRVDGRCSRNAEAAVYFTIAEALTNAAKHSRASECRVVVRRRDDGTLWARVEDNGSGGARVIPGGGLDGITNRVLAAGGTIRIDSPNGGPSSVEVSVPCGS